MVKAILGFVAFIFLVLFIIIMIARGGGDSNAPSTQPKPGLASAASSGAAFTFTEYGPIVANENHYSIEVSVSKWNRSVKVIEGYEGQVVASQSFNNNEVAFGDFLSALDRSGYTQRRNTNFETEAGLCPLGKRFVFESDQFDEDFRAWTTNCQERGSFGGNFGTVQRLFVDQIPDYNQFISDTRQSTGLNL